MGKENINLPKTEFSMKANLPNKEPGILDFWNKIDLYNNLTKRTPWQYIPYEMVCS